MSIGSGVTPSLFVEGRLGEGGYGAVLGGVRVYIGSNDKTSIRRHREDDPVNLLPDSLFGMLNSSTQACNDPALTQYNPDNNECFN